MMFRGLGGNQLEVTQAWVDGAIVDRAIVKVCLSDAYEVINDLLRADERPSKELIVKARRMLPEKYSMSFYKK